MIDASQVSACLVTRGDQPEMMARILDSLLDYDEVIVWDNSVRGDRLTAGRFYAMEQARNEVCYTQDDDVVVPRSTQEALLAAYEPGMTVANYAHGNNDGGYHDVALVGAGGLMHRSQVLAASRRWFDHWGAWQRDELAYADFIVGVLTPFKHIHEPFEINMSVAQHESRLCNQEWSKAAKRSVTERARTIREGSSSAYPCLT